MTVEELVWALLKDVPDKLFDGQVYVQQSDGYLININKIEINDKDVILLNLEDK